MAKRPKKNHTELSANEKIEYETCTSLIKHYETIRMNLSQFFAIFNGALLGFLAYGFTSNGFLTSEYIIIIIGFFAFIVCLSLLNAEIREMSYWVVYIKRAREIEENINSRNNYTDDHHGIGFMDTYRGTYREIVMAKNFLKGTPKQGYSKPKDTSIHWVNLLYRSLAGSRRTAMQMLYIFVSIGWLGLIVYGTCVIDDVFLGIPLRFPIIIVILILILVFILKLNTGIRKKNLIQE